MRARHTDAQSDPYNDNKVMERLIEAVRTQPCLWNPYCPTYRDMIVKEAAWETVLCEIRNHCSSISTVQEAKTEWRRLRDNHRDALKRAKLGKNKLLPAQITTWKYAKAMQFLEPHMKYRITENIEADEGCFPVAQTNTDHQVSTTETSNKIILEPKTTIPQKKRKLDDTETSSSLKSDVDPLESFFVCILQSTRAMPPHLQTCIKKKIFAVMIDAEETMNAQYHPQRHAQQTCRIQQPTELNQSEDNFSDEYSEITVKTETVHSDYCD